MSPRLSPFSALFLLLLIGAGPVLTEDLSHKPLIRRPVGLVLQEGYLYSANRRSGSISAIDLSTNSVCQELKIGTEVSSFAALPNGAALATDEAAGSLMGVRLKRGSIRVEWTLHVGFSPVSLCAASDGSWCSVALLWAHRLALVDLTPAAPHIRKIVDLPFAPRKQCLLPDGKSLVVADSFGGNLALVDAASGSVRVIRSLQAHNIRGLSIAGDQLLISHPILEQAVSTTDSNVFWGSVIGNVLQSVSMKQFLDVSDAGPADRIGAVPIGHWSLYALGDPGYAAGDPGDVLVTKGATAVIALSGVNEIAAGSIRDGMFRRLPVGRGPVAVAASSDGKTAYVANEFDDSVSVVSLDELRIIATIRLGSQPPLTQTDRGEILFHDARLSRDGWYSCNTCHTDGHTCGLKNDNFSDGSFGTPKRILTLLGAGQTGPWAWNASNAQLEGQVHKSIVSTMQGKPGNASEQTVDAIAAYVRALKPPPSLALARGEIQPGDVERGRRVFERLDCVHCHKPPAYTSDQTYDVGLSDEAGMKRFNPPSLLGVSQLPALFHDNRASTLRDVFLRFKHPDGQAIPESQLDDLLAFLRSL